MIEAGILQVIFEEANCGAESFAKAEKLRSEFVVAITGEVAKRGGAVNENLATGDIEVIAKDIRILAEADTPPFPIEENSKTKEDLRLKYRYLDLRRPDLQKNNHDAQQGDNTGSFLHGRRRLYRDRDTDTL